MSNSIVRLRRTVNYFNITFSFKSDSGNRDQFLELFQMIVQMSQDKEADRYKQINGSLLFVQDVKFFPEEKQVHGKIRAVRGITPEILDTREDAIREIDMKDYEGVVETTHFVLSYKNVESNRLRVAIVYNDAGAKAKDFEAYLRHIGQRVSLLAVDLQPILNQDVLGELQRRMGRCKEVSMQVQRDAISLLKKIDSEMGGAAEAIDEFMRAEIVNLRFQYDFKKLGDSQKAIAFVSRLAIALKKNPTDIKAFKQLEFRAEDTERNGLLQDFNLIEDRTVSTLLLERKLKSNALVDSDVYEKVSAEMQRLKLI
jgi:hypothetical protein